MQNKNRQLILLSAFAVIILAITVMYRNGWIATLLTDNKEVTVIIDAGHGGSDPGKIGVNQVLEKDINLAIAKTIRDDLVMNDINVIMTREAEGGLYDQDAQNKKVQDLNRRLEIMEKSGAVIAVSIHQNSYHQEECKGAQVFYHGNSEEGRILAEMIQTELVERLDPENGRRAKANTSYYLLKKTKLPTVIVECGFLSNWKEAELLSEEEYQKKTAWAVAVAIMKYLNGI